MVALMGLHEELRRREFPNQAHAWGVGHAAAMLSRWAAGEDEGTDDERVDAKRIRPMLTFRLEAGIIKIDKLGFFDADTKQEITDPKELYARLGWAQ